MNGDCIDCVHKVLYGPICNLSCSSSCISSKCNDDGECLNGCSDGYTGVKCDTVQKTSEDVRSSAGMVVVWVVVGISATLVTLVIIKRRHIAIKVIGEVRSAIKNGRSKTDINNVYEDIDDVTGDPSHNQEYEMTQTSTEGVERRSCQYSNTTLRQCY
ncbi:uncharacterized protein LOC128205951 [Mya arenaria]|uniref:uncharacterized protein LOC128205951 n=1 Tax=Mya arenaria TaxID=6604 RepID=UPI0022E31897|nr:uncharacterized protein LOC128205951 [Mya arenaria]